MAGEVGRGGGLASDGGAGGVAREDAFARMSSLRFIFLPGRGYRMII